MKERALKGVQLQVYYSYFMSSKLTAILSIASAILFLVFSLDLIIIFYPEQTTFNGI